MNVSNSGKFINRGFTLIEVTVSVAIFSLLAFGVIAIVGRLITHSNQYGTLLSTTDQSRKLSSQMMGELRNAVTSATGAYSLDTAGDQQLIFYSDVGNDGVIDRVRYFIQGANLMRGVVKPSGSPVNYNLAGEKTAVVQNNLANGAVPLFYYYADTYNGTNNNYLIQPVNVTQVKFIKLNLQAYNSASRKGTSNTYTVTAGGAIRNLKTNLGN